ncbi:protein CLAVATA 3 [Lactuca sativa]|uniref:protein CLAVATA 3 n=1 Tax=Lactuca sativa TaxID=4236 RepID=UPI001C693286|nr:protein CLAVATA 3 [Lactuca sativa]
MAFALKSLSLSFVLLLGLLLLLQLYDGLNGAETTLSSVAALKKASNRKLLVVNDSRAKEAVFMIQGKKEEEEGWELRAAPLGPDPLHHHGADPKKPRTP